MLFSGDTLFPGGPGNTSFEGGDFATIIRVDRRPSCSRCPADTHRAARPRRSTPRSAPSGRTCRSGSTGAGDRGASPAKADYAVRAMCELAARTGRGPVKGDVLAAAQHIPVKFLENILGELKRLGDRGQPAGRRGRLLAGQAGDRDHRWPT